MKVKGLLKTSGFWTMVLALTVLTLVFSGCGGGSRPSGNGGSGEPGEIDLTAYIGTWVSPAHVVPSVEFTISEFLESEETMIGTKIHHFKGSVKCTVLAGGEIAITQKWDPTAMGGDSIKVQQYGKEAFLFVDAGNDADEGGTVKLSHGQWDGNNLRFNVEIREKDNPIAVYETAGGAYTDVFSKK